MRDWMKTYMPTFETGTDEGKVAYYSENYQFLAFAAPVLHVRARYERINVQTTSLQA